MKNLMSRWLALTVIVMVVSMIPAIAQLESDTPLVQTGGQSAFDPATADFPTTNEQFWTWGIALITPVIVWGFGKIPQLPRPVLPVLTPFVGILLGMGLRQLELLNLSWVDMAQAGALAVFIRESVNQLVTKQLKPLEASKTVARPVDNAIAVPGTEASRAEGRG